MVEEPKREKPSRPLDPSVQRALDRLNSPDIQRAFARFNSPGVLRTLELADERRRAEREFARFNSPDIQRAFARFNSPEGQRALDELLKHSFATERTLEQPVSWPRLADAADVIIREYEIEPEAAEQLAALEEELPEAEDESRSWADALASLSLVQQVALLTCGLLIADKAGLFLTSFTGEKVPEPVRAAIELLFAVIAFLLLWIEQQSDGPE